MRGKPFEKGHKGLRAKGVENKVTKSAKELILQAIEGQITNIAPTLESIRVNNEVEYMKIMTKLLDYIVPKKVDMTSNGEQLTPFSWIVKDGSTTKNG